MSSQPTGPEAAVVKLEEWFTGLSPEEQEVMAPVLTEGILATMEGVDAEVTGFGQTTAGPPFLQALSVQRAPTITWMVGMTDWVGGAQPPNHLRPPRRV